MSSVTFILCTIISLISAILLMRSAKGPQGRFLFWGAIYFLGAALNNILLYIDAVVVPDVDWALAPNLVGLVSIAILIYALIWEAT